MSRMSVLRTLAVVAVTAAALLVGWSSSSATAATPTIRLVTVLHQTNVDRYPGDNQLYISPGVYLAALNGAFEIDAYANPDGSTTLWHVKRGAAGGVTKISQITPTGPVTLGDGLPDFLNFTLTSSHGKTISQQSTPFCPGEYFSEVRVDQTGPDKPSYPFACGSPLSKAVVWGIDKGWGAGLDVGMKFPKFLPDGSYNLTVSISPAYASQLGVPTADASSTVSLAVATVSDCSPEIVCGPQPAVLTPASVKAAAAQRSAAMARTPAALSGEPDMRALPAHDLSVEHNTDDGHDYLDFGATIWNGGTGPLDLEGFRQSDTQTMNAIQYIYSNGSPDAGHLVGQFEFDTRPGHNHWHMEDVAQYDLLDSTGRRAVLSEKQSFCLAPTDPINMVARGADWSANAEDISSECQGEDAIWLREVLPAGWGDTYYQSKAGQSFDITDQPNGTYTIRITTDPNHTLIETNYSNNVGLLAITLGGTKGHRTVTIG